MNKPRNEEAQEGTRQSEKDSKFYNNENSDKTTFGIKEKRPKAEKERKKDKRNIADKMDEEIENSQFLEQYYDLKKKMEERQQEKLNKRRNTKNEIINYKSFKVFEKISEEDNYINNKQNNLNINNLNTNNPKNAHIKKLYDKRISIKPIFDPEIDFITEEFSQEVSSFVDDSYSNLKLDLGNDANSTLKLKKEHANTAVPEIPNNKISDCIDELGDKCRTVLPSPSKNEQNIDTKSRSKLSKLFSKDNSSPQKEVKIVVKEQANSNTINHQISKDSNKLKDKRLSLVTKSTTSEFLSKHRNKLRQKTASTEACSEVKLKPLKQFLPKSTLGSGSDNLDNQDGNENNERPYDFSLFDDKSKILVSESVINNLANQSSFYSSHFRNSADYNSQSNINSNNISNLNNNVCNSNNLFISQLNNKSRGSQDFHKSLFDKKSSNNSNSNFNNKKHVLKSLNSQNSTFYNSTTISSTVTTVTEKRESLSSSSNANISNASSFKRNSKASSSLNSIKYTTKEINIVDILNSKDARTTIMIRHIPNKYTLEDLVYEIDEHFYGKYTYINLPLDYSVRKVLNKFIFNIILELS